MSFTQNQQQELYYATHFPRFNIDSSTCYAFWAHAGHSPFPASSESRRERCTTTTTPPLDRHDDHQGACGVTRLAMGGSLIRLLGVPPSQTQRTKYLRGTLRSLSFTQPTTWPTQPT